METLVVVADYRNQYYSRGNSYGSSTFNCRAFETGGALLPTPLNFSSIPLFNASPLSSPKTPPPTVCDNTPNHLKSGDGKQSKKSAKKSPIPINFNGGKKESPQKQCIPYSERWAGPAYSNSPPPSSLPIPKFWMKKPKRSASLELPPTESEITPYDIAKSAPSSPTREFKHSAITFLHDDETATKTLRRILNLDVADD